MQSIDVKTTSSIPQKWNQKCCRHNTITHSAIFSCIPYQYTTWLTMLSIIEIIYYTSCCPYKRSESTLFYTTHPMLMKKKKPIPKCRRVNIFNIFIFIDAGFLFNRIENVYKLHMAVDTRNNQKIKKKNKKKIFLLMCMEKIKYSKLWDGFF